jgi:ABC-type amino acid transport system permease subunit
MPHYERALVRRFVADDTAGLMALITYHAAYFAEILRDTWATVATGQC